LVCSPFSPRGAGGDKRMGSKTSKAHDASVRYMRSGLQTSWWAILGSNSDLFRVSPAPGSRVSAGAFQCRPLWSALDRLSSVGVCCRLLPGLSLTFCCLRWSLAACWVPGVSSSRPVCLPLAQPNPSFAVPWTYTRRVSDGQEFKDVEDRGESMGTPRTGVHFEVKVGYTHPGARSGYLSDPRRVQGFLDVIPVDLDRSVNDDLHEIHFSTLDQSCQRRSCM
jgi:hypothetical protein